jgi:hypothetical protein
MSDNVNNGNTAQDPKVSKAQNLLAEVADRVKESGPQVYARLRDAMVEREISSRADLMEKAFQRREQLQLDFRKVNKPDNETFNADGTTANASYSKPRLEEIKKAREVLEKLESAMEKALVGNDFKALKEVCK